MAQQIPRPEEVVSALASIPPRLSVLARIPAVPEDVFESAVKSATGVELPPGPNKVLAEMMERFEVQMPAPPAPQVATGRPRTASELTPPPSVETPAPRRRFELT